MVEESGKAGVEIALEDANKRRMMPVGYTCHFAGAVLSRFFRMSDRLLLEDCQFRRES
jgi:hypothetical protein